MFQTYPRTKTFLVTILARERHKDLSHSTMTVVASLDAYLSHDFASSEHTLLDAHSFSSSDDPESSPSFNLQCSRELFIYELD